jgi:hypothetical protein
MTMTGFSTIDKVKELIALGYDSAEARRVADEERHQAIAAHQAEQAKQAAIPQTGYNQHGLPGTMRKTPKSGASYSCCDSPCVTIQPGGEGAKGTVFGPSLVMHYAERVTGSGITPKSVLASAGANSSTCEPDESAAWQMASILAASPDVRLFVDGSAEEPAVEFSDREEWLLTIQERIENFYNEVVEAKTKVTGKRKVPAFLQ